MKSVGFNQTVTPFDRVRIVTPISRISRRAVTLPSFTVYDAMVAYKFTAFGRDLKAQLNVKNLTDELYREGSDGYFGQVRTWYLSLATRF